MSRRTGIALAALGALLIVAIALHLHARRPQRSPEQRIMLAIAGAEEAAERSSVAGVVGIVSNSYADDAGNDRQALSRLVVAALRGGERWRISTELDAITVEDDSAQTWLKVTLWGEAWPDNYATYSIALTWRKEGRHWRVIHSDGWQYSPGNSGDDMPPFPAF